MNFRTLLPFTVFLLVACNQRDEYLVKDLTTYESPSNLDEHSAAEVYPPSRKSDYNLEFSITEPLEVIRLKGIKSDTIAVSLNVRFNFAAHGIPMIYRIVLASSADNQICEICTLESDTSGSPQCDTFALNDSAADEFISDLNEMGIWDQSSFPYQTHRCDELSYLEIRQGVKYKLLEIDNNQGLLTTLMLSLVDSADLANSPATQGLSELLELKDSFPEFEFDG